ncbi:MAG: hypothetical protein R6V47_06015, partial [Candidatus Delongbacteria bacterium]
MSFFDKIKEKLKGKKKSGSHLEEIRRKRSIQLYEAAVAYYKRKDYVNSKKFFEKSLQYNPENQDAKHNLTVVKRQIELIEEQKRSKQEKKDGAINRTLSQVSEDILKQAASTEEKNERFYYKALRLDSDSTEEEIKNRINTE